MNHIQIQSIDLSMSFQIAETILKVLIDKAASKLYDNELYRRSVPHGIKSIELQLVSIVEILYTRHEIFDEPAWEDSIEPSSILIDSWARSVIPVHKKFAVPKDISIATVEPKTSTSIFKAPISKTVAKPKLKQKLKETFKIAPIEIAQQDYDPHEEFLRLKKARQVKVKEEENVRAERQKLEEKKKRQIIMLQNRGKVPKLTYDCNGNLIIVSPLREVKMSDYESVDFEILDQKDLDEIADLKNTTLGRQENKPIKLEPIVNRPAFEPKGANIFSNLQLAPNVFYKKHVSSNKGSETSESSIRSSKSEISLKIPQDFTKHRSKLSPDLPMLEAIPENDINHARSFEKLDIKASTQIIPKQKSKDKVTVYKRDTFNVNTLSPIDEFNLKIISNSTWGANPATREVKLPARIPKNTTNKQSWEIYGHIFKKINDHPFATPEDLMAFTSRTKMPKDRPYVNKNPKKISLPPNRRYVLSP